MAPFDSVSTIAHVELHDGVVSEISFRADGGCRIVFEYIFVYLPAGEGIFELWTYSAELLLTELVETRILEEIKDQDYIADDQLFGADGEELGWKQLIGGSPVSEIRLAFPSGFRLSIRCRHAELRLGSKIKRHKDWHEPL